MPCVSDHMEANERERKLSQVACLLDELDGKKEINKSHWAGYHPKVYCVQVDADKLVRTLCTRLKSEDVSKRSLEMQVWWRDHQESDRKRARKKGK